MQRAKKASQVTDFGEQVAIIIVIITRPRVDHRVIIQLRWLHLWVFSTFRFTVMAVISEACGSLCVATKLFQSHSWDLTWMYFDVSKFDWPSWESAHFSWLTWGPNWPSYVVKQTNTHTLHHNIDITNTWRKHSTSNYLFYFPGKLFIYRETAYHGCWKRRGQWWRDSRTTNPKIRRSPAGRPATLASTIEPRFYARLRPPLALLQHNFLR